jgi:hypothetical protein
MKRPALIVALAVFWIGSVVAAYLAGRPAAPSARHLLPAPAARPPERPFPAAPAPVPPPTGIPSPEETFEEAPLPLRVAAPGSIDFMVMKPVRSRNPVERIRSLAALLDGLDKTNIVQALASLEDIKRDPRVFEINRLLWFRWGQLDGNAAMTALAAQSNNQWSARASAQAVLSGWASLDPDAAITWAKANHEGPDNPFLVGVIQGVADRDPYLAFEVTKTLPYGSNRGQAVDVVIEELFEQNPATVPGWVDGLEDGILKNGVVTRVAARWAQSDPEAAANWARRIADTNAQAGAIGQVVQTWAWRDAPRTAAFVEDLPDSPIRAASLAVTAGAWVNHDPDKATAWAAALPAEPAYDPVRQTLAGHFRHENPRTALAWATAITDETSRFRVTDSIVREWMRRDPDAAQAYIQGTARP